MNGCKCVSPGHCPWHDCVTDEQSHARCKRGKETPSSKWEPCLYLGEENGTLDDGTQKYVCKLHEVCTLHRNNQGICACRGCPDRLRIDDPELPKKWKDPLRITDRYGHDTDVLRNFLQGGSAFLVAGGPSTNQLDFAQLRKRGIFSFGINNVAGHVPVSAFTFSDPPQKFHWGIFCDPKIMSFCPTPKLSMKRGKLRQKLSDGSFQWLPDMCPEKSPNTWGYERRSWLSCDHTWFTERSAAWGNQNAGIQRLGLSEDQKCANTTFLGLRVLQYLGARRIYLLGVDFYMDPKKGLKENYAFEEDRDDNAIRSNNKHFRICNDWFAQLRPVFEQFGFETYNCNQMSHLRAFDYVPFEEAVKDCQGLVPDEPFDLNGWYVKM